LKHNILKMGLCFLLGFLPCHSYAANESREFLLSCTYGVLAGSLVGAATLAFSENPSDNLNRIARGFY
jgi:hypothetical protein